MRNLMSIRKSLSAALVTCLFLFLEQLINNLNSTLNNITSATYTLRIEKYYADDDILAMYITSFAFSDKLELNTKFFPNAFNVSTLFHELTHTWSDDGESGNAYINAHMLESVFNNGITGLAQYRYDYRKIFE